MLSLKTLSCLKTDLRQVFSVLVLVLVLVLKVDVLLTSLIDLYKLILIENVCFAATWIIDYILPVGCSNDVIIPGFSCCA